jgi:hypothetical protein
MWGGGQVFLGHLCLYREHSSLRRGMFIAFEAFYISL